MEEREKTEPDDHAAAQSDDETLASRVSSELPPLKFEVKGDVSLRKDLGKQRKESERPDINPEVQAEWTKIVEDSKKELVKQPGPV